MIETAELSDYLIEYYPLGNKIHEIDLIGLNSILSDMHANIKLESKGKDKDGIDVTRLYIVCSDCNFDGIPSYANLKLYKAEPDMPDLVSEGDWLIDIGTYTEDRSAAKAAGLTYQLDGKLKKFGESGLVCSSDEGAMHQLLYISPTDGNPLNFRELKFIRDRCKIAFTDDNITAYKLAK